MAEEEKMTTMVLNVVNLQCSKCYKKVKKLLCKFPEIRDQTYDEKANKVTIKVQCCSPEKIRDKLCCKGGGCIKSIEIKEPKKKKEEETEQVKKEEQTEQEQKKPEDSKEPVPIKDPSPPPVLVPLPIGFCCDECYSGRPGGPCWRGERVQCDGYYGRPVYDSWGWCGYRSSYAYYYTEQNQQGCTIM